MQTNDLKALVLEALDDGKAKDIQMIDVRGVTNVTDTMIIASGTSTRHVVSVAEKIVEKAKEAGYPPIGVEGEETGEWVLVDLGDIVIHVMYPPVREFYQLERLWDVPAANEPMPMAPPARVAKVASQRV